MRVKRYIVDSMPQALERIKTDLGSDAVILNSKPIKTGGVFGMFSKQRIEVIAAIDEKASEENKPTASDRQLDVPSRNTAGTYTAQQAYRRPTAAPLEATAATTAVASRTQDEHALGRTPSTDEAVGSSELKRQDITAVEAQPVTNTLSRIDGGSQSAANGGNELLANEVRDMRKMFEKLLVNDLSQQLPEAVQLVRNRLMEQEVSDEISAEIIRSLMDSSRPGQEWTKEEAFRAAREKISAMFSANLPPSQKLERNIEYAFFFGPTGVGKTTTIAKLAANSMLQDKRKIGFITADTYRMAAIEQLKTYANILNVPLEVVFSPKEMAQAMERLSDCDLIFVDTAGRNFRNDEYVEGIRELVQHGKNSVNYLVLSLTSKYSDMKAIIQNFSEVQVSQIIFTKADETHSYGSMLNVSTETGLALSYITTGQNVPDDIMVAQPGMVSTMIMGD
ncbi:flagellar biosynthesis protein FlhF [Brevibacillus sp. AY1]|uniref:flagellar biosynthesis protein FlhF n=1 Tax=Brevibacillus sp. AY1 TaxID=2807621 RepID=UPI002456A480|nr:flagellar biosynthesis protein FlhF [Brevibacillus sp. AY1]MDH4617209.1 flagellar biosynthesis protein FlhF [Brevibacillus sp. AY1]